jgi:exosortase/archaeosortase family protein
MSRKYKKMPPPAWWAARRNFFIRFGIFLAVVVVVSRLVGLPAAQRGLDAYAVLLAQIAGGALLMCGEEVRNDGPALISICAPERAVVVAPICTGATLVVIFVSAIAVWPARRRAKLVGFVVGLAGLCTLNLLRVAGLYWVRAHRPELFDVVHEEISGAVLIGATAALLLGWAWLAAARLPTSDISRRHFELLRRIGLFCLVFALAIAPGVRFRGLPAADVRALVDIAYPDDHLRHHEFADSGRDQRIVIINTSMMAADGSGPIRQVDVNPFILIWLPAALLVALVSAAPLSAKRRTVAVLSGLVALHFVAIFVLAFTLWYQSAEVNLVVLTQWQRVAAEKVAELLVQQVGLVLPVVWFLLFLRPGNASILVGSLPQRATLRNAVPEIDPLIAK